MLSSLTSCSSSFVRLQPRRTYIPPRGLEGVSELLTLRDYKSKKKAIKDYRIGVYEGKAARDLLRASRPPRPRIARQQREELLKQRWGKYELAEDKRNTVAKGIPWESWAAVLLERLPVITPDMPQWEEDMLNLMAKQRWEEAHDWPAEMDIMHEGTDECPTLSEVFEQSPVPLAPRVTEADHANDRISLDRALQHRIFLLLRKDGASDWQFLQSQIRLSEGETFRGCAERLATDMIPALEEQGGGFSWWHVGNAPAGWHWEVYDEARKEETGFYGRKTFYARAQVLEWEGPPGWDGFQEHVWVTKEEMKDYLSPELAKYMLKLL
jgi:large subunit ribosomal protein L46